MRSSPRMRGCFVRRPRVPERVCSLPRACGGVSESNRRILHFVRSSPRMRGCFLDCAIRVYPMEVFPAHAGVFLSIRPFYLDRDSLPRACGGVSETAKTALVRTLSSPRMRGCFFIRFCSSESSTVFPAHAGVFLRLLCGLLSIFGLPRACGGVSRNVNHAVNLCESSPRMRGCFRNQRLRSVLSARSSPRMRGCFWGAGVPVSADHVFPAHAGVFL